MFVLILGVALWSAVHFVPMVGRPLRARLIARLGAQPYQGVFSLGIVVALVLIVLGWRSTPPVPVILPPEWGRHALSPLMFVALWLFVASTLKCNLKRWLRHPQLLGVATWAGGHLLANGERRSWVLFGGLGLWAIVSILLINRRDGAWQRPEPVPWTRDARVGLIAAAAWIAIFASHSFVFGVSPMPV